MSNEQSPRYTKPNTAPVLVDLAAGPQPVIPTRPTAEESLTDLLDFLWSDGFAEISNSIDEVAMHQFDIDVRGVAAELLPAPNNTPHIRNGAGQIQCVTCGSWLLSTGSL